MASLHCWGILLMQCFRFCELSSTKVLVIILKILYSGQGAAMAFEDAAVLGLLSLKMQNKSQLPDILSIYERIRKPRTMEMRSRSRAMRDVYAMRDGPEQQERDRQLLQHAPFEGFPNFLADPVFQKWLFAYDALGEAEKAWKTYSRGEWPGTRGLWKVQA